MLRKIVVIVAVLIAHPLMAAVMNSGSYSIESDSINFGGGNSASTGYRQESTFGEIATGPSGSATFNLTAGYQQMDDVYISIAAVSDVTLTPSINGSVGGTANGSTSVLVTTNNSAGYELYIKASSSPALVSGSNSFADYTQAGVNPDFLFSVPASTSEFAMSPEGTDIVQKYRDDGVSLCGVGILDTPSTCWAPLGVAQELISASSSGNHPGGTATTIRFRAESGTSNLQPAGTYTATTTVTAIAL